MRYPLPKKDAQGRYKLGVMKRVCELIDYSKLDDRQEDLSFTSTRNVTESDTSSPGPDFHAREMGVESEYVAMEVEKMVGDIVEPFARMLMNDLMQQSHKGWDATRKNDVYSLRAYMSFKYIPSVSLEFSPMHLATNVINWCETFDESTSWYDRSLTEILLEALAFAKAGPQTFGDVEWKFLKFNKSVMSISEGSNAMKVSVWGEFSPRTYSHVISTIPLPGLRTIDLSGAVMQRNALRGQSFTDLSIRIAVYPSDGVDSCAPSAVLNASYCWTNDAERLGPLINTGKTEYNEQLKEIVLRNLEEVHNIPFSFSPDQHVDTHAWDRNHNPLTMGAFAFFGPGDFQYLYASLTVPNHNKRLHFAREAISTRHAWVVGALDSAWRAVYEYLLACGQPQITIKMYFELWGRNIE
ncbi:uncharacterized protein EDB91DRAFT_1345683 [Suillus paluster]|uniref:uncharacterized protein n=1 Tax=Suillus paluster TaxID=48578 RepID=UPI001B87F97F|nr:uncharacterized protein EDB91DRAFT_1345683 [Suillus paluster]KAG1745341.1 hypothetical protein EDB91DRAFT_1345683 [Suillus paluster]